MNCLVGFCGLPKSGKTTLATKVADQLHCQVASFGAFVKKEARRQGLGNPTRRQLQHIGDHLASGDIQEFCRAVLDEVGFEPGSPLVIDGIRHVEVIAAIHKLIPAQPLRLIYLEAALRRRAIRARLNLEKMKGVDAHPVESEGAKLRSVADLVLDTSESEETSLAHILLFLGLPSKTSAANN